MPATLMLPTFPKFKKIELSDRTHIESHTSKHSPYSDFNFTNLWAWDVTEARMVSELNGNLVVLFTDYITCEPGLSFIGNNCIASTVRTLIDYSICADVASVLRYIPEESVKGVMSENFRVEEDERNYDYVFSVLELANMEGKKFKQKRRLVSKFLGNHPHAQFLKLDFNDKNTHKQITSTLYKWWHNKKITDKKYELEHEELAINRLLDTAEQHNLILTGVLLEGEMIAFSIDEILPNKNALSHFIKADLAYKGIYEFLNREISRYLMDQGVEFWNWEQDLGIEGLRQAKKSYRPAKYFKKYKVY